MASDGICTAGNGEGPFTNPWPALFIGLAATAAALFWQQVFEGDGLPLAIAGLLASGAAVAIRPQASSVLALAALSGLFAHGGMPPSWDSARLLVAVLTSITAVAALLVLLPRVVRRIVVSLLILVHFSGILTAVSSVPPRPVLFLISWIYFYRPYLEFMYLTNAYHFYSPEPGPGMLVWFYVKYEDGSGRWRQIPRREDYPLKLEYQRRLSVVETVNQVAFRPLSPEEAQQIITARQQAGARFHIDLYPGMDLYLQRQELNPHSKLMLETYARHVAHTTPHPTDPEKKVTSIKIYRVRHILLSPKEVAAGKNPKNKFMYFPYYLGEFDPDGHLKDPSDPFLYWVIPVAFPGSGNPGMDSPANTEGMEDQEALVLDLLESHARLNTSSMAEQSFSPIPGGEH